MFGFDSSINRAWALVNPPRGLSSDQKMRLGMCIRHVVEGADERIYALVRADLATKDKQGLLTRQAQYVPALGFVEGWPIGPNIASVRDDDAFASIDPVKFVDEGQRRFIMNMN